MQGLSESDYKPHLNVYGINSQEFTVPGNCTGPTTFLSSLDLGFVATALLSKSCANDPSASNQLLLFRLKAFLAHYSTILQSNAVC